MVYMLRGTLNRLSEFMEDWAAFTKHEGFRSSLALIRTDLLSLPYRRLKFVIVASSLLAPLPNWQPKIPVVIRQFVPADLDWVRQVDRPSEARLCAQRLAQGHHGLAAVCNQQPAGYAWGSPDLQTRLERVHPGLVEGDFLCTDAFTCPAFRGQGIQTALTLARFQLFQKLGYRRAVSTIDIHNQPSLAVWQRKLGGKTIGTIDFMRIGPWYKVRYDYC
jgi:GNAT superfamily N-acetyltransferase